MSMFAAAIATLFESPFAVDGIYMNGAQQIPVRVIKKKEDGVSSVQGIDVVQSTVAFDIQSAQVMQPKKNDTLRVYDESGETFKDYKVRLPVSDDPDNLIWTIYP